LPPPGKVSIKLLPGFQAAPTSWPSSSQTTYLYSTLSSWLHNIETNEAFN
jgi:hypothetical protein